MRHAFLLTAGLLLAGASFASAAQPAGLKPLGADGKPLNLDFETGDLRDWIATGEAFQGQPIKGDVVIKRLPVAKSQHQGDYWIGGYEVSADAPQGKLTSVPFKVTQPWASFLIGGGRSAQTRAEVVLKDGANERVLFRASGEDKENMSRVTVNLTPYQGKEVFVRLTDESSIGWGHVNFDDFAFYESEPNLPKAAAPPPPSDLVKNAGLTGEEAAKEMTLPAGFKSILFAGEPDVQQPIAFCLDDRGRVWVAEGYTYPRKAPEGEGKDRILVLEDTDSDGKFNKRTVFMEKLNLVSGLEVGFGGVWIGQAPHLLFVPVSDWNEPKPAGEAKILLDGWDFKRDSHETLNTFLWGPDGWLYGCHGVFCPSLVGKPGTPEKERLWVDAAVWRYHPTKHVFEIFAEGTSNPWGIDFDANGQCFIEACVVPHFWHVIQGARYQRQGGEHYAISTAEIARNERHREEKSRKPIFPYTYADIQAHGDHVHWAGSKGPHAGNDRSGAAGGGHAHAGLLVYQGDSWPAEYRGKIFMNNIHGQRINMDVPERRGSGYVGRHGADFINFNDKWSQVLNLLSDQNGSVFLIDWYDKNQCHHNDANGHDRSNGRIFKIVHGNTKTTPVDLMKTTDEDLAVTVFHKNEWHSRHARRLLQERAAAGALNPVATQLLRRVLNADNQPARLMLPPSARAAGDTTARLRALWALHLTGGLTEEIAIKLLKSPNEYLRAWTIQLLCEAGRPPAAAQAEFVHMAKEDASPFVRLYLASACQRLPLDDRAALLVNLLAREEDAEDHNLPLMYWYAVEPLAAQGPAKAVSLLSRAKIPKVREFITKRMTAGGPATPEK